MHKYIIHSYIIDGTIILRNNSVALLMRFWNSYIVYEYLRPTIGSHYKEEMVLLTRLPLSEVLLHDSLSMYIATVAVASYSMNDITFIMCHVAIYLHQCINYD